MVLIILAVVIGAVLLGRYWDRRAPTPSEDEAAKTLGTAIRNTVAAPLGESLGGQGGWEFSAPPSSASFEPDGGHVYSLEPTPAPTDEGPSEG